MIRESFGEKLDRGTEPILEDIDKVPLPESYLELMRDEEPEKNPNFDINPEEGLIDKEENERQEEETEETYKSPKQKEKPKQRKLTKEEKIKEDLEINKKIIKVQSEINEIKNARAIETDKKKIEMFDEHIESLEKEQKELFEAR
jgi:hypothetical protein